MATEDGPTLQTDKPSGPRVEVPGWQIGMTRGALRAIGAIAPGLASRAVLRLFRTIRRHRRPGREVAWLRSADRLEIEAPGGRIAAHVWGDGPPVLLAHGWEGRGSQMGALATGLASAGRCAVAYDAPGHGDSKGRVSSLIQFAEGVARMIEARGPFAGFVGHSFGVAGACFALWRGAITPEQLGRLVFIAPPGDLHRFIRFFEEMLGLSDPVAAGFEDGLQGMLGVPWAEARHCTVRAACSRPLLIIHDDADVDTPIEDAWTVASAWPDARQVTTSGLGHRRILRDPEVVRQVVEFLSVSG